MSGRAVITFSTKRESPCIYLRWNGGRASVEAFLISARKLGVSGVSERSMDALACLIADWMQTEVNRRYVFRLPYGHAEADNKDYGVYVIDGSLAIRQRLYADPAIEDVDPARTAAIIRDIYLMIRLDERRRSSGQLVARR